VQAPTKYKLAINLKTARPLGITMPQSLLAAPESVLWHKADCPRRCS